MESVTAGDTYTSAGGAFRGCMEAGPHRAGLAVNRSGGAKGRVEYAGSPAGYGCTVTLSPATTTAEPAAISSNQVTKRFVSGVS